MLRTLGRLVRSSFVRGVMGSIGGAAAAALGWKVASDVYDVVKQRIARSKGDDAVPKGDDAAREDAPPSEGGGER